MTGNKAYLAEYQDFNGSPVAFGGSKGYITGKGTEILMMHDDSDKELNLLTDYLSGHSGLLILQQSRERFLKALKMKVGFDACRKNSAAIQDSESLDSCRFALWEEGNWNKMGLTGQQKD
ncbi:hypothetical protein Tco_0686817 [Tanacetum coccineum]